MGWEHQFFCEINPFCLRVLRYYYPDAEEYGDIKQTDFGKWRGQINVLAVGFPCQPFSVSGKREGDKDDRYLWPFVYRAIQQIRPDWICIENVTGILSMVLSGAETEVGNSSDLFGARYLQTKTTEQYVIDRILNDLTSIGYETQVFIIPACSVGAPHKRDRVWIVANLIADSSGERFRNRGDHRKERPVCFKRKCFTQENQSIRSEWEFGIGKISAFLSAFNGSGPRQTFANPAESRLQEWVSTQLTENKAEIRERINNRSERSGKNEFITDSHCTRLQRCCIGRKSGEKRTQQVNQLSSGSFCSTWQNFPTESPICDRNDGFPNGLSGITFSNWRTEALKALGNSIVPEVALQIYKAIESADAMFYNSEI